MGNAASSLPFVVSEEVAGYPESEESTFWRLHRGTKRSGGDPVSIFRLTLKMCPVYAQAGGRHGFQKLRTLRHPYILACLDSAELETEIVLATEEVMPLRVWVREHCEEGKKDDQVAWGLHCLCSALKFLHEDCKLSHNNISMDTVFVNSGGDWKLGGMDLLAPLGGDDRSLQMRGALQPRAFRSPERSHDDWWRSTAPIHAMDVFALGRLLEMVYPECDAGVPPSLDKYVLKMLLADPSKRPTPSQYLRCAFVKRQSVKDLAALELFSVKTPEEKANVLLRCTPETHSKQALLHKLAPLLLREIVISTNATPGAQAQGAARAAVGLCLQPLLELSKVMDDEMFHAKVQPTLAGLFAVNDRGVRVMLLTNINLYGKRLEDKVVNEQVFEPLCAGFTDAAAALRELTLKSMVAFTSRLSEKNMNEKLIKHLARLQGDAEDSIRTNAIIFLGKVAAQLKPAVRDKVLLPAFARGVKDPFVATRLAGLRATAACHQHFRAEEVCAKVLPSVMPCLIDSGSAAVREAAFGCVTTYMEKLKEVSERMKVEEEERRKAAAAERAAELALHHGATDTAAGSGSHNFNGGSGTGQGGNGGGGGGSSAAPAGAQRKSSTGAEWGSWALGKLTETLTSSALPSSGPVGAGAGGGGVASPPSSVPRHHTSQAVYNGTSSVAASIPGSVAAAVAAGLPIGGGGGEVWNASSGGGGGWRGGAPGSDVGVDENWQDARETLSNAGTDDSIAMVPSSRNDGSSSISSFSLAAANATIPDGAAAGQGWDWDGLDGLGDDDASPASGAKPAATPVRLASLKLGGTGAGGLGGGAVGGAADAAKRREDLARRREARKALREKKPKASPSKPVAKKFLDSSPPDGWDDF